MTLLKLATEVLERLKHLDASRALAKDAEGFQTRADQIEGLSESLKPAVSRAKAMRDAGIAPVEAPALAPLIARARRIAAAFEADPKSIVESSQPSLDASFLSPLRDVTSAIDVASRKSWQTAIDVILGEIPEDLLALIEAVAGFSAEVRNIRIAQALGGQLVAEVPADGDAMQAALDQARRLRDEIAANLTRLRNIPEAVMDFFVLVVRRQARLGDVTEAVRTWLVSNKMLDKFLVTLGS